jgi:hypothetical protein
LIGDWLKAGSFKVGRKARVQDITSNGIKIVVKDECD